VANPLVDVTELPPAPHPDVAPNAERVKQVIGLLHSSRLADELLSEGPPTDLSTRLHRDELEEGGLAILGRHILEVDSVVASLLEEQHDVVEARLALQTQQTNTTTRYSIVAIVLGGGLGLVGTSMQLSDTTAKPGDIVGAAGGAASVLFGMMALHAGTTVRMPGEVRTGMLARLLDRTTAEGSNWPPEMWAYMTTPLAGQNGSYQHQLLERWTKKGRISLAGSARARAKIDRLTSPLAAGQTVDLDELADRAAMLVDAAAMAENMKRDLYDVVRYVQEHRASPAPGATP
jgi:hypothetical protein